MEPLRNGARPWTVYVLAALSTGGTVWTLITQSRLDLWAVVTALFGIWVTYSMWVGKRWAFSFAFMMTTLCAVFFVGVMLIRVFLLEMPVLGTLVWGLMSSIIWITLLMHPATKRFAGLDPASSPGNDVLVG